MWTGGGPSPWCEFQCQCQDQCQGSVMLLHVLPKRTSRLIH